MEYIRTSRHLKNVCITYKQEDDDDDENDDDHDGWSAEVPENYRSKIDDILFAVRQGPSKKGLYLNCLGNPKSIRDLLAGCSSLAQFTLDCNVTSKSMADSIAAGLKENQSLQQIGLRGGENIDIMVSGLCHHGNVSTLEGLSIACNQPSWGNKELGVRIVEAIQCTPSIRKLTLSGAHDQGQFDYVLKNLHHPKCTRIKTLNLDRVDLGSHDDDDDDTRAAATWIPPHGQINNTVEELDFEWSKFTQENSMKVLWNLRGLRQLNIRYVVKETHGRNRDDHEYWAKYIRYCTELRALNLNVGSVVANAAREGAASRMFLSILNGSRGHNTLQHLTLKSTGTVPIPGGRLRSLIPQILQETKILRELYLICIGPDVDLAAGLADGLRHNKSLQKLVVNMCGMEATHFRTILVSLFNNHTLQHFGQAKHPYFSPPHSFGADNSHVCQDILETMPRLFRVNKSLCHISLPCLNLDGRNMQHLLEGLGEHIKSLDLINCKTDRAGFLLLVQALVGTSNLPSLEHIILPRLVGPTSSDIIDFFRSLVRMRRLQTIGLDSSCKQLLQSRRVFELLLLAVQENKIIGSFGGYFGREFEFEEFAEAMRLGDPRIPIVSGIRYNLKLNHFGRRVLDMSKILRGVWPAILARMTKTKNAEDALYFFIREFFMRHSYPLQWERQRQGPRSPKRARVQSGQSEEEP